MHCMYKNTLEEYFACNSMLTYVHHRTYRGSSSKDLTEYNGEFGSCRCTSTSWTFSTSLVRRTLVRREASAACVSLSGGQGGLSVCSQDGSLTS